MEKKLCITKIVHAATPSNNKSIICLLNVDVS